MQILVSSDHILLSYLSPLVIMDIYGPHSHKNQQGH